MKKYIIFIVLLGYSTLNFSQNFQNTKGELAISNSGIASYSIPIALPPTINNAAPLINLSYNSGARGGIAGQGWGISSISSLTRIATRRDIDGYVDGVDFDVNDKLALDGQRLLIKTGNYWENNSIYETEYKSNIKIELKIEGNGIGAKTYFIVTGTDGSRTWYGSTGNGVLQNATSANAWYIIRYEDVYGNYITYNYSNVVYNSTNQLYIESILFSGNEGQGLTQLNKILFTYVNSARVERDFIKGVSSYATKILNKVEVFTNNTLFRQYKLTRYPADSEGYERVQQVQEFNGMQEASNPIVFEYYTTPLTTTRNQKDYTNNFNFSDVDLGGDFDGDGRLDFVAGNQLFTKLFEAGSPAPTIYLPFTEPDLAITTLTNNKINQAQSLLKVNKLNSLTTEFKVYSIEAGAVQNSFTKTINLDMTVTRTPNNNTGSVYGIECWNYLNTHLNDFGNSNPKVTFKEGDFDGNGISEVLIIKPSTTYTITNNGQPYNPPFNPDLCAFNVTSGPDQYYLLDMNPNSSVALGTNGYKSISDNYDCLKGRIGDFNGDGKSDILSINSNGTYKICDLYLSENYGYTVLLGQGTISNYSNSKQILFGDFNGDGKTDLILPETDGGSVNDGATHANWIIYYSNPNHLGGEFFTHETFNIVEYWPDTGGYFNTQRHWSNYYAMDINKDGKSDIVRMWRKYYKPSWTINDHNTAWSVSAFTNNIGKVGGSGFTQTYFGGGSSDSPWIPIPIASNFKQNNLNTDLVIVLGQYNVIDYYSFDKDFNTDNRLHYVKEANNNIIHTIDYKSMEAVGGGLGNPQLDFYSSSNSVNYPDLEIIKNPSNYLVSKLTSTVNGISKFQDFRYYGYVANFNYGTVGFKKTARSSWYLSASDTKIWSIENNDVSLRGANTISWTNTNALTVFSNPPTNLLSTKTNVFDTYTNPNTKVYNVLLNQQTTIDELTGVRVEKSFTYDGAVNAVGAYALQTNVTTNYYNGTALEGTSTSATPIADYDSNPNGVGNAYYIGRPKRVITSVTTFGNGGNGLMDLRTSEIKYSYTGANLTKIEKKGHNTDYLVEEMTYDAVGNMLTKTVSMPTAVPPIASRMITDVYDPSKRFVNTKTDHQGFVSHMQYNPVGQVTQSTDYMGVVKDYAYDNWGKITQSTISNTSSTPLVTTTSYAALSDGSYTITSINSTGDNAMNRTQHDVLGRVIKTTTKGFINGTEISKTIEYDGFGRKYRVSEPYFTSASKWTVYQYDYLHRPIQINLPTTRLQTIAYSGLTTTVVDDGKVTTSTLDALGNKIRTTDPGGVLEFSYYANGILRKTNLDGHEITIGIDGWGNKTSTFDPNAGLYTYSYDAFGQIINETTPKGNTSYVYDNFGKLTSKKVLGDGADFNTIYGYNALAQLETETSTTTAGASIDNYAYTYDNLHRLSATLENNANLQHTKTFTFDGFGRVATETNYTKEKSASNFSATTIHKFVYNAYNGIMYRITDNANVMLWQLNNTNEKMQVLAAELGNGVVMTNTYDSNYYFASQAHKKNSTYVVNNTYLFDDVKGNLTNRQNLAPGMNINEAFTYDNLDRLLTWSNPATGVIDFNNYDTKGRITDNNKLGNVRYNTDVTTGIYRKTAVKLNAEGLAYYNALGGSQQVSYTMFKAPITINESNKGKIDYGYNSHLERNKMLYDYGLIAPSTVKVQRKTKLYTDDGAAEVIYDRVGNTIKIITYIGGDAYSAVLYSEKILNISNNVTTENKYYLHRDYLGSIIAISNTAGVAVEKRHFDAWGNLAKIVNSTNVSLPLANGLVLLDRGYTGHEHLQEVRLIHMNGRLYDPVLRSFLMPDNFVQQPENTQNYNRFAYCFNNPLRYTDPSGETGIGLGVAVVIAVAVAMCTYTLTALLSDVPFTATGLLKTAVVSAAIALCTYGIGTASENLFSTYASRTAFSAVAHGTFQGGFSAISGGKFWTGFASGALSSIAASAYSGGTNVDAKGNAIPGTGFNSIGDDLGSAGMIAFGTVAGGAGAELTGGNFWQGAATGLVVSGLNHAMHDGFAKKDSEVNVLDDTEGAEGGGHLGLLAGNDEKGWTYVSKEGRLVVNGDKSGTLLGGGKSEVTKTSYSSKAAALSANPRYDKVATYKTTYSQALRAINATYLEAQSNFNIFFSNCGQSVAAGLRAAGLYEGSSWVPNERFQQISDYMNTGMPHYMWIK